MKNLTESLFEVIGHLRAEIANLTMERDSFDTHAQSKANSNKDLREHLSKFDTLNTSLNREIEEKDSELLLQIKIVKERDETIAYSHKQNQEKSKEIERIRSVITAKSYLIERCKRLNLEKKVKIEILCSEIEKGKAIIQEKNDKIEFLNDEIVGLKNQCL